MKNNSKIEHSARIQAIRLTILLGLVLMSFTGIRHAFGEADPIKEYKATITGIVHREPYGAGTTTYIVDKSGKRYDLFPDIIGAEDSLQVGQEITISGIVRIFEGEEAKLFYSPKKQKVAMPVLILPAKTEPVSESEKQYEKDIKRRVEAETYGTIELGHDEAGGYYWINGGRKKQYTIAYFGDSRLTDNIKPGIDNWVDAKIRVKVKGRLILWKDGNISFDDRAPIEFFK